MPKVLSIVNLKGGVGKTAIAVNFAAYAARNGYRTLLIDLDPQTNATFACIGIEQWQSHSDQNATLADLLGLRLHMRAESDQVNIDRVLIRDAFPNMDLIPSHVDLFTIDLDLASATGREFRLKRAISPIMSNYDLIVCDCPPNLTMSTQNALAISTHYVVPVSPDFLSGIGIALLLNRISRFCDDLQIQKLRLAGIVMSRVGRPAEHRTQTIETIRAQFTSQVLNTQLVERVAVSKSAEQCIPVYDSGDSDAANEFTAMSRELLERIDAEHGQ